MKWSTELLNQDYEICSQAEIPAVILLVNSSGLLFYVYYYHDMNVDTITKLLQRTRQSIGAETFLMA
jgi:hypothetical protein